MSIDQATPTINPDDSEDAVDTEPPELAAQLDVLIEENQRLREEYSRAQRTQYRRSALALIGVGVLAAIGGVAFPDTRTVLFALSGTGIFAGLLTYFLTPEQFIPANIGESVYTALADNETALVRELGLHDTHVYVPRTSGTSTDAPVQLYIPQYAEYDLPDRTNLDSLFIVTDTETQRGVALQPTGVPLFREFEQALTDELRADPEALTTQLIDGLSEQFELVERTTTEFTATGDQVSVGLTGSTYGPINRFDHPVASFLGVGFAVGIDQPITLETTEADDRTDYLVTCSWDE